MKKIKLWVGEDDIPLTSGMSKIEIKGKVIQSWLREASGRDWRAITVYSVIEAPKRWMVYKREARYDDDDPDIIYVEGLLTPYTAAYDFIFSGGEESSEARKTDFDNHNIPDEEWNY